jgi:hypothetical protein
VKLHEIEQCNPHSLSVVSDTTIFLGCSSAHEAQSEAWRQHGDFRYRDRQGGRIWAPAWAATAARPSIQTWSNTYHAASNGALVVCRHQDAGFGAKGRNREWLAVPWA